MGLDVHKRIVEACILDNAGNIVSRHRFDNFNRATLAAFAKRELHPTDQVALEAIHADGGNPFRDYQLPAAVIKLKQGFGR